ncbi:MAG: MATE family efflux transporter [Ruminococcaceae bacterium]|nr:MATE family efflux transporter [Oscillospiraceae bacterium]
MRKSAGKHTLAVIFALAWPTMLEQLMQTAVQYIDVAMVGALGTAATAAVGATTTVNWLVGSTVSALGVGFLSFIAKACGAGDRENAARAATQAVLTTLVCGVLFTALTLGCSAKVPVWMQVDPHIQTLAGQYFFILYTPMLFRAATTIFGTVLRAAGDTKTPMRVGVLVNLTNVVLNFLLIYPTRTVRFFGGSVTLYGAGMGVLGAATASAIAFTVGGICITAALWRHPLLSPRGRSLRPDKTVLLPCLRVALPNMLQRFGTSLGYVAFASMINALGEIATAAHTVANTVESAFYIPAYGMQTAAATLAGNALGAADRRRMRETTRTILAVETVLMCLSGGLLFLLAPAMLHLFSDNPAVIALGSTVLRMVAVTEPIFGIAIILEGVMLGVGRTVAPFVFNVTGMWGVRIVGTFLCTRFFGGGLVAAWGCMIAHNLLLFLLFLIHYFRGTWNPLEAKKELSH